jgi:hypothetical protein
MTIVGTVEFPDPPSARPRATLRTLLDRLAPNGQMPANVRIDDGVPDYSGVGGICAIDSGCGRWWRSMPTCANTGDLDLLAEYPIALQRVMHWLAGWTATTTGCSKFPRPATGPILFGRSYHVLYDEVLWYRATVAYGRCWSTRTRFDEAAEYLRRSQALRARSSRCSGPQPTARAIGQPFSFADPRRPSATPATCSRRSRPSPSTGAAMCWETSRAFISNVLDVERARTAFQVHVGRRRQ